MSDVFTNNVEEGFRFSNILSNNEYIFYYDETNNFRKIYLHEKYSETFFLNSNANPFVLGGLVFKKEFHNLDQVRSSLDQLFKNLNIQKTQKEFKFKHIAKGDLNHVLRSKKLFNFFQWILNNEINIHIQILDVVFWAIVDIVESKTAFEIFYSKIPFEIDFGGYPLGVLKSFLYDLVQANKREFFKKIYELGYPEINSVNRLELISFLHNLTIRHENDEENKYRFYPLYIKLSQVFKEILEEYKNNNDGFVFLEDEPKHKIINKMNVFYQNRIDSFPKSLHIFDQEYEVEKEVETIWRSRGNKNYIFMSSHEEVFIQLSDIVIGFFRVLFEFLIDIDFISIDNFVNKLEINQKQCLKSFFDIYDCSINETEYFIQYITPLSLKEKMEKIYSLIKFGF